MVKKKVPIKRVILANLAELNASKRSKVDEAAEAEGFKVVQIYPRPWHADALRRNPAWRIKLLKLPGNPYSLTRPPIDDLDIDVDSTVGRTAELAAIRDTPGDVLVTGVPGVGKTHLVAQVPGGVFVEQTGDITRLADDLLETDPSVVVLDDAGARLEVLTELQTIRRAHGLCYRIIAVCWPHEIESVADRLEATNVEVDRMTKAELGEILRAQGITRPAVLRRILDQAHGRPAWAVRIGALLKEGTNWKDVMRGHTVRAEVGRYLRNARISDHAYQTLATIALLGGLSDTELTTLADLQRSTVPDLWATLRKVAQSGLLDAQEGASREGDRTITYTVQPELLASSTVADAYFSAEPPPHPLAQLRDAFRGHEMQIVTNSVTAELVGASHPWRPSTTQVIAAVGKVWSKPQGSLLTYYAILGKEEATFVLDYVREALKTALSQRNELEEPNEFLYFDDPTASLRGELLAEVAANSVTRVGYTAALEHLTGGALLLLDADRNIDSFVKTYFEHVRTADIGEPVAAVDLVALSEAIAAMPIRTPQERRVFAEVASHGLAPVWEANYMVPDKPRSFEMKSFLLPHDTMARTADPILDRLETIADTVTPTEFEPLVEGLSSWVHVACGYSLPFGLNATTEHVAAAGQVARRLAHILAATRLTPSTRLKLNEVAAPLKLRWEEPDELYAALTGLVDLHPEPDDGDSDIDYVARFEAAARAERERIVAAMTPFVDQEPEVLCSRLAELRPDLQAAGHNDKTHVVFEHIAKTAADPIPWIRAALDYGLGLRALALVQRVLAADTIPKGLLTELLETPNVRSGVIHISVEYATGASLAAVMAAVTVADFGPRTWVAFVRVTPEALAHLNGHPDKQVAALAICCWAAWYSYVNRKDDADNARAQAQLEAIPDWTDTMLNLEVPNGLDEHALERGLVSLARTSPDNFTKLMIRHVDKEKYPLNDFDEWAAAAHTLDHEHKTAAWRQLGGHPCKREVFWVLAGKDTKWIGDRLNDGSVADPSELLGHVGFRPTDRPTIEEIAALFADRVEPELIISSLPDTMSGDEVEVAQYRLGESRKLAASDDADIRAVGEAGVRLYTPVLEAAKKKAREHELRGEIWY
jgi:hypothetical protein